MLLRAAAVEVREEEGVHFREVRDVVLREDAGAREREEAFGAAGRAV